jgi:hypothetical protein
VLNFDVPKPNPWLRLTDKPYVLRQDAPFIASFNETADARHKIELDVFPDPFVGSPAAPIWLLNLNPGLQQSDYHHPQHVIDMQRRSIALEADDFWYLDNKYAMTSGYEWWRKKTRGLTEHYDIATLKAALFVVEFFPYHSERYKPPRQLLPSQEFTRQLVRAGCKARRNFVIMRGAKQWLDLVPELADANRTELLNAQGSWITLGNVKQPLLLRKWLDEARDIRPGK